MQVDNANLDDFFQSSDKIKVFPSYFKAFANIIGILQVLHPPYSIVGGSSHDVMPDQLRMVLFLLQIVTVKWYNRTLYSS